MSFDKYLKTKPIVKTIDPGTGDSPSSKAPPTVPKEQRDLREVKSTPISSRIDDLIELSKDIQQLVTATIADIEVVNSSYPIFSTYHKLVKENHFNPASLMNSPEDRPVKAHQQNEIKAAERVVYREIPDPRAPFVQDLYDHLSDAGLSEFFLTNYWKRIVEPNELYEGFSDSTLSSYVIDKEEQHLIYLRDSANRIKRNTIQALGYGFLKALANKISSEIFLSTPTEQIASVGRVSRLFKQIKTVLMVTTIMNTNKWEQFASNLKDINNDFLQIAAAKVARVPAHSFLGALEQGITTFTDGINRFLPLDLEIIDIPEAQDFLDQIDGVFGFFLGQVEDDLVFRDGLELKLEENRQILITNSQKNSRTKQFLETVDGIIKYLDEAKYLLQNSSYVFQIDIDTLTQTLVNRVDSFITKAHA